MGSRIDTINLFLEMCVSRFLPSSKTSSPENHLLTIFYFYFLKMKMMAYGNIFFCFLVGKAVAGAHV